MGRSARRLISLTLACAFSSCFAEVALGVEQSPETTAFHPVAASAQPLSLNLSSPHQSTTVHFNSTGPLQTTPVSHRTTEQTAEQPQATSAPGQHGANTKSSTPTDSPGTATQATTSAAAALENKTSASVPSTRGERGPRATTGTVGAATNTSLEQGTAGTQGTAATSTSLKQGTAGTRGTAATSTSLKQGTAGTQGTAATSTSLKQGTAGTRGTAATSTSLKQGTAGTRGTAVPSPSAATGPSPRSRGQTPAPGSPTATAMSNTTSSHTGTEPPPTSPASTVRPPPAPQPSAIPTGTYTLSNGNSTCIKAVMGLQLIAQNTPEEQMEFVTVNPNATKISGSCGMVQSSLNLTFSGGFVNITFVKQAPSYSVTKIESRILLSSEGMLYYAALNEKLFTTKLGNSFKCASRQTFLLERNFQILFVHMQLQAFDIVGNQFGKEEECFLDRNSKVAPIAVCLSLLGLFVIVFATFLISRRKPHRGYERI